MGVFVLLYAEGLLQPVNMSAVPVQIAIQLSIQRVILLLWVCLLIEADIMLGGMGLRGFAT